MSYIFVLLGFVILIKGADFLVDGASALAKKWGVSSLVIGLTVVAFGTSAPELFINVFSALKWDTGLAIGNVIGSNLANTLLILGLSAIVYPLKAKTSTIYKEIPFNILISFALFFLLFDSIFWVGDENMLSLSDGFISLLFFLLFFSYSFGIKKTGGEEEWTTKEMTYLKSILFLILGIIWLAWWADMLVKGATDIARSFWVSDTFIGLTIIAIGTSLPELMTSVVASFKKNSDIAIGNVIGSNIFNILLILWITSLVKPIMVETKLIFDMLFLIFVSFLLFIFMFFIGKKWELTRFEGGIFVFLYFAYIVYLISSQVV